MYGKLQNYCGSARPTKKANYVGAGWATSMEVVIEGHSLEDNEKGRKTGR